jgi:hypothetical protein
MAGRMIHHLGFKAQGNAKRPRLKTGKNEFQRLQEEGWKPEFLADPNDRRIEQIPAVKRGRLEAAVSDPRNRSLDKAGKKARHTASTRK